MKLRKRAYFAGVSLCILLLVRQVPTSDDRFRVLVAAGGTGGHIFPAVAVVEQLQALTNNACDAVFLGSRDRMEHTIIPALGYRYVPMPIAGFKGLHLSTLTLPLKVLASIRIARQTIREFRPHAVVCTGAYISYPAGIAAAREGVPLIVLESNLNPGKTNARLAPHATSVVVAFAESIARYPASLRSKLHDLGNPVRAQIDQRPNTRDARTALHLDPDRPTVFVFGGSLGARTINATIAQHLSSIAEQPWQLLWQTGKGYTPPTSVPDNVRVVPFVENMGVAYAAADLVVSRSGATTIAELGIVGKPAVFIPLPSASTNEQVHNAEVCVNRNAAVLVRDADLASSLVPTIVDLMHDAQRRASMATAMKELGKPHAARDAAMLILHESGWRGQP